jgi:hypothetical protein
MFFFFFLGCCFCLQAIFVGNFASPCLDTESAFLPQYSWFGVRAGYVYDYIYKGRYEEKFKTLSSTPSHTKILTQVGLISFMIKKHLDIYGFMGKSHFQLDDLIYSNPRFSWGAGAKLTIAKFYKFRLGIDGKYFYMAPRASFFSLEKKIAPLISDFFMEYEEIQGAIGLSYKIDPFVPYAGLVYLHSSVEPHPKLGLLQIPLTDVIMDFTTNSAVSRRSWGAVLGTSIVSGKKFFLNLETRFAYQNAYSLSGELRF